MLRALLLLGLLVFLVAGCGRVKPSTPNRFTLGATEQCLKEEGGLRVDRRDLGVIAPTASEGAIHAYVGGGNSVVIMFGRSDQEVADLAAGFRRITPRGRERQRLKSLLEPRGNALINWISEPTVEEADLVRNCLK